MADEIKAAIEALYPPLDKEILELVIIKRSGETLVGHFDKLSTLLAVIDRYDRRDETLAIYSGLNRIKHGRFEPTNNIAPGRQRSKAIDIDRITSILIDIDPFRSNVDHKDSTTDKEHDAGIEAAQWIKSRLSLMGWPEPVVGDSGNGGQLRYKTDLPATEDSCDLIKRMLEASNRILPHQLKDKVEVDTTTHDRPRISKVFGTVSRKGPGTEDRPWRRSRIISIPTKWDTVRLDHILKLINAGCPKDENESTWSERKRERAKPLSEVENDRAIRPCLKEFILKKNIKRLEEFSAHEHKGRVAIAVELMVAGYSDDALHEFFSRLDDYEPQKTTYQLDQIRKSFIEKGGRPWRCETLRTERVIPTDKCNRCNLNGPTIEDMCIRIERKVRTEDGKTDIKIEYKFDSDKASKAILANCRLKLAEWEVRAREPKPDIWTCRDGVWRRDGEYLIEKLCDDVTGSRSTRYVLDEVKRRVRNALRDGPIEFDTGTPYLVATKNGYVCNLITGQVRKKQAEDYISEELLIPIDYNPESNCPETFRFYDEICATDCEKMALIDFDAAALDLTPRREISERLGGGSNGKGVKQQHQRAIFGPISMAGISLKDLNNDKFALVELFRKRILTCSETTRTDDGREYDTAILKQITGKDLLNVDEKFKKRFGMVPFCKPVIDANTAPRFNDSSPGFTSRFRRINFPYEFKDNPNEEDPRQKPLDSHVIDLITTPEELSGYLNVLLHRAQKIVKNGTSPKCKHLTEGYQEQVFSLDTFVEKFCELRALKGVPDGFYVLAGEIHEKFDRWAKLANASTMSKTSFGISFSKMVGSKSRPCEIDGETKRAYLGVKFDDCKYQKAIAELEDKLKKTHVTTSLQPSNSKTTITNNPNNPNRLCEDNVRIYSELKDMFGNFLKEKYPQKPVIPVIPVSDSGSDVKNLLTTCKENIIESQYLQAAEEARKKEAHFRDVADKYASKKWVVVRFLQDIPPYKADDVASFRGCFIDRDPPIVQEITCGQCPTAIRGAPPACPECYYLKRAKV